jgi:ferredoxin
MTQGSRNILICSCEDTIPLDEKAVRHVCHNSQVIEGRQFCQGEIDRVSKMAAHGESMTITCTQEAPLFEELARQQESKSTLTFVNIRETAGWSKNANAAGPKIAALIAAAAELAPDTPYVNLTSEGMTLLYGADDCVLEVAKLLKDHLNLTVLIKPGSDITPPRITEFPVVMGTIRAVKGFFGAFEVTVDNYALPNPSSRGRLVFGPAHEDAKSHWDILIDLSGGAPLFSAHHLRDGYLRADPHDSAAVLRVALKARDLVGPFDKPRYIAFSQDLCAHSRSNIVGCHRCLDLCPTGAITPTGDYVAIDPYICAGCGQCAAACPTGAATYTLPPADTLLRKLRILLSTYRQAGGVKPIILLHDKEHGGALIDALARFGDGLPANILPVEVNEITQIGLETMAAVFAYGASALRFLTRAKPRHDMTALLKTIAFAQPILAGLGYDGTRIDIIDTDDPDVLGQTLSTIAIMQEAEKRASFSAIGNKRELLRLALRELHAAAPHPVDVIALPECAPIGSIEVKVEGCTLCLACVSTCPTGALSDNPDQPMLRFAEDACVQCGLCKATCPENVISLKPQIDFLAATAISRIIKQEEPAKCIRCGRPFGVKGTIERVLAKLENKHWMYKDSKRLDVIRMCEDCRVQAMAEEAFDPFAAPARPRLRTTDDYLHEREQANVKGQSLP